MLFHRGWHYYVNKGIELPAAYFSLQCTMEFAELGSCLILNHTPATELDCLCHVLKVHPNKFCDLPEQNRFCFRVRMVFWTLELSKNTCRSLSGTYPAHVWLCVCGELPWVAQPDFLSEPVCSWQQSYMKEFIFSWGSPSTVIIH